MFGRWKTRRRVKAFLARDPVMVNANDLERRQFLADDLNYIGPPEHEGVPVTWLDPFSSSHTDYHKQKKLGRWDWGDINQTFKIEEGEGAIPYRVTYDLTTHPGTRNEPYAQNLRDKAIASHA